MKAYYDMPSSSLARCMVMSLVLSWPFIKSMMNGTRAKAMGTPVSKTLASYMKRCTMGDEGAGGGGGGGGEGYVCARYVLVHLYQQIIEITTINFVVIRAKTMTNFWNMSNASAPIHITAASVK